GDQVESIKLFDPESQRSLRGIPELYVPPASETAPLERDREGAYRRARLLALELGDALEVTSSKLNTIADDLGNGLDFFGRDALAPLLHEHMDSFFDYLGLEVPVVISDPVAVGDALRAEERRHRELADSRRAAKELVVPYEAWFLDAAEVEAKLAARERL